MRTSLTIFVALMIVSVLAFTGFQCGSAELTSARLYLQQKEYARAEESLIREVQKNPSHEDAWFLLGQVRLEMKKYIEANQAYDKALALSDVHKKEIQQNKLALWSQFYKEGIDLYNEGMDDNTKYHTALEKFRNATIFQPDSGSTYYVLGLSHYALEDLPNAEESFRTALKKGPGMSDASKMLGQLYIRQADEKRIAKDSAGARAEWDKAALIYEEAHKANPEDAENILSLVDLYERTNQEEKALELTRGAVTSDPTNLTFRYAYGVFLLKQGKYGESIKELSMIAEAEEEAEEKLFVNAIYNLGVANLNWGVRMKSESDAKRDEEEKKGRKGQQDLSYREKFKAAVTYLEKSVDLKSDDPVLWDYLGRLYANLNMTEKSRNAFTKADQLRNN